MLFRLLVTTMAATKTAILAIYEASDAAATGAQAISGATATVTANTNVIKATVDLASLGTADTVTINGVVFTQGTTAVASRTFANAAGLVSCVNSATYGVPGVTASDSSTTVTLVATDPGEKLLTVAGGNVGGTVTVATVEAMVEVEVQASALSEGFTHLAAKVTVTSNSVVAVAGNVMESNVSSDGVSAVIVPIT
jgi:hypothetical protein